MSTNYANEKLTKGIRNHLLDVDAVPPNAEMSKLAGDLAQVCLKELNTAGLAREAIENFFGPSPFRAKARAID